MPGKQSNSRNTAMEQHIHYAPGAHVVIRDAEQLVSKVDRTSTGDQVITVVGLSELVKDRDDFPPAPRSHP